MWYIQDGTKMLVKGKEVDFVELLRMQAKKGVKIRILLNYLEKFVFPYARDVKKVKDQFEVGLKNNPNMKVVIASHPHKFLGMTLGSCHEKMMIIDDEFAFCGGIEFERPNTDADENHNPSKYVKNASTRHDVHSMVEGQVVADFKKYFETRWIESGGRMEDLKQTISASSDPKAIVYPHTVRILITKSQDASIPVSVKTTGGKKHKELKEFKPYFKTVRREIIDEYLKVIKEAQQYIYIENQYFRDSKLADALLGELNNPKKKDLQIIILLPLKPEEEKDLLGLTDHALYLENEQIRKLRYGPNGSRVGIYSIIKGRKEYQDIYVHSKVMIIDDRVVTIGSANTNPRSFFLDNEINILVLNEKFGKDLRLRLWSEHLEAKEGELGKSKASSFVTLWNSYANKNKDGETNGLKGRLIYRPEYKAEKLDRDKLAETIIDPKFKQLIQVANSNLSRGFIVDRITEALIEREKIDREKAQKRANQILDTIKTIPDRARNILVNVDNKNELMRLFPDNFDYYA